MIDAGVQEWRFDVLLDGRPIGAHVFRVEQRDGERRVESDARFDVKFLFVNAYTYVHQARERWQGDCLKAIEARTDDNGKRLAVREEPPGCVMSFAYWNPAMLKQTRLLNAQTGELNDVRVEPLGAETITVRGAPVSTQRYALHAPKFRIDVWYGAETRWVQLESRTETGRTLRYLIR